MTGEVSPRACLQLLAAMEARGFDIQELLYGLPLDDEALRRRVRVPWSLFTRLLRRLESALGGPEGLEELGEAHVRTAVSSWFGAVARTVIRPRELYWLGANLYGQSAFRNVSCRFEDVSPLEIRETLRISPGSEDCPQFFHLMLGVLRSGPAFLNYPNALVKMELAPRRARYTILLPNVPGPALRLFRRLRFFRPALTEVIDELRLQHQELLAAYNELAEAHGSLQAEVAERERTEGKLRQAQRLEALGRLAGGVAHDFNNILSVIYSYAETASHEVAAETAARADLDSIKTLTGKAAKLTRDLFTFSEVRASQPSLLDVGACVRESEDALQRLVGDRVRLTCITTAEPALVLADARHVEQVLVNLVANARDAMPEGGDLTVSVDALRIDRKVPTVLPELTPGRYVVLSVRDTGAGIDAQIQERMFEPFFTTRSSAGGTGLGLSIVWVVVEQSSAHIGVESASGQGTTIRVYFPAARAAPVPTLKADA